jgi:hypothetical protein
VIVLLMTDGRGELLQQTLASLTVSSPPVRRSILHDDSGDRTYRAWLAREYGHVFDDICWPATGRVGQGAAIASAWREVAHHAAETGSRHVFHVEDDFRFPQAPPLATMAALLDEQPHLQQIALLRQPWYRRELVAGGIVEADPDAFEEQRDRAGRVWLEHRACWTFNPCVYRSDLCTAGYIDGDRHERRYGQRLCAQDPATRFAYLGARGERPRVEHLGHERAGTGY